MIFQEKQLKGRKILLPGLSLKISVTVLIKM